MTAAPARTVVAFDFDETLTTGDSVIPFMRRFMGPSRFLAGLVMRPMGTLRSLAQRDRSLLREIATDIVFTGVPHDEVRSAAAQHAEYLIENMLRPDTTARLGWHVEQGHQVVIVSASYEDYLQPVADHLGAHAVISTRLEVVDGRCTGHLDGPNCRGPEKVHRLAGWLEAVGHERSEIDLWAYGDSAGDREMLTWSDRSFWVDSRLASVAPSP